MSQASEQIREMFSKGDNERDAGLTTPENIVRYDDIAYGPDPAQQSLDVYRPKSAEGRALPVIVSVHGGGWVYGDKERYQFYCMDLAQRGFAVVNFTYRLAPENKFPASLEDTNSVFTWVLANAERYGFDTAHVFGVGDSAGGHGLGLYAALCTDPEFASQFSFAPPEGFAPRAIALNCGAYNPGTAADGSVDPLIMELMPGRGTPEELALINVLNHITEKYPPVFFMTAMDDFLKAQAAPLAAKLAETETPFVYRLYGSRENRLAHVFHLNIRTADAKLCNDEECEFFRKFL